MLNTCLTLAVHGVNDKTHSSSRAEGQHPLQAKVTQKPRGVILSIKGLQIYSFQYFRVLFVTLSRSTIKKMFSEKSSRIEAPGSSDVAAEVIRKPLTDCLTSNALKCSFNTLTYIIMRHKVSCQILRGGLVTTHRHHKCKINVKQYNQGQISRQYNIKCRYGVLVLYYGDDRLMMSFTV